MHSEITYRTLSANEVSIHREFFNANPDPHLDVVIRSFPRFAEISRFFDPDESYWQRQRFILGAFDIDHLIGTVAIEPACRREPLELTDDEWDRFFNCFTERELDIYNTWNSSFIKTYLLAPDNTLNLHSLAVSTHHRRKGIAHKLIEHAVHLLSQTETEHLYTETARDAKLMSVFREANFTVVRKSFSWSERFEYGQCGSVLLQYHATRG